MKTLNKIKLRSDNEQLWPKMEEHTPFMSTYLSSGEIPENKKTEDIVYLMILCLRIVVGELYANAENHKKYHSQKYSEEDFVDMVIESITHNLVDINNISETIKYVEDFRSILWGHAKCHCINYLDLFMNMEKFSREKSALGFLRECMTIVTIECMLRRMEDCANKL